MILSGERARVISRTRKATIVAAALIAGLSWLLMPDNLKRGLAQTTSRSSHNVQTVNALGDRKAFDELVEMALRNPDFDLRRLAAIKLTEIEGDGSTMALVQLYDQTPEPEVKMILIDALARSSEIEPLTRIALTDPHDDYRLRALRRIKFLKARSESNDVRNWNVAGLADQLTQVQAEPPPPRPPRRIIRWRVKPPPPPAPSRS